MEETKRTAHDSADQARRLSHEFRMAIKSDYETASRSFAQANRGLQAIATEVTNYSRKSVEDVLKVWEQLLSARSLPDAIDIQTRYAQKAFDAYISELTKLTDLYLDLTRNASRPIEQIARYS
jgi:phasin family protein